MIPYYDVGGITIYHSDCETMFDSIPLVDCVITDPPYGIGYQSNMRVVDAKFEKIKNDIHGCSHLYPIIKSKMRQNTVFCCFCSFKNYHIDYFELNKILDIKNSVIWNKGGGGIGDLKHALSTDYEIMIVAHNGSCMIRGKRTGSVWNIPKVNPIKMRHPTEKPVALIKHAIMTWTDSENVVFDPFMGSGTTLVAAKETGRKAIGIEINERYCEIASRRLDQGVLDFG